jgi:hypothetical protein
MEADPERLNGPYVPFDRQAARGSFVDNAATVTNTPQGVRERDVSSVINELAATAGIKDTPEFSDWKRHQAELGDKITRTVDPADRAALRIEREAGQHEYVAALGSLIGETRAGEGRQQEADDMATLAHAHKDIAAGLRVTEDRTPPDRGEASNAPSIPAIDPPRPQAGDVARAEFAENAAAVGREIGLGPTARTVHVEQIPAPQQTGDQPEPSAAMGDEARRRATNGFDQAVFMVATPEGGASLATGPKHQLAAAEEPEAHHDILLTRHGDESSKRQEAEDGALRGATPDNTSGGDWRAKIDAAVKAGREVQDAALATDKDEPLRPEQGHSHTVAFRSFGR